MVWKRIAHKAAPRILQVRSVREELLVGSKLE
jgi:hypothetical protein